MNKIKHTPRASDWQPIETAPRGKKGWTWMNLAWGPEGDQSTGIGMRWGDRFFAAGVFYCLGQEKQYEIREVEVKPTHWMPTLGAPTDVEEEDAAGDVAHDALMVLEMIAAEDDAARHNGTPLLTSGVRMTLDAALIKAGRKEAPVPVRHFTIAGVDRDAPRRCSFCFEADCNGECSGDGAMGD
ncbi:TPA: hypothetical protein QDC51_001445 [Burkholderia multivorans]|nr:hypothetical protein [Burkholderia multivorans]HDR9840803.1 hypothetical protein [Burkholderia multivorans]HDR9847325.1 hypothetical protein [Burkholderia multivorans]HDR9853739.1 hypothetical protein [Burkholderia multivorans]